ncbi:DUF2784 domain-containing protein [Halopseudomonas nanhaiensis]|uniref:DUF2784 domain-containing protein n=1 Tax=Halopseudomonas nanhaiensis TaxID=2830842 RepID=UPI001CBFE96D|nr:DUF2784 domain-containing protein [Halopseudomonas nanhaiensis]UAW97965.1 DUF2784 domain-containing protein [Halopseudomonas nanhaiensis]
MNLYQGLADLVLTVHVLVVAFVVLGLMMVVLGNMLGWRWVNSPLFRLAHLAVIAIVVAEAWLGIVCPLTTLERWLRVRAGIDGHDGGFIEYWLQRLLYYQAPDWVFTLVYTVFGSLVLASWWLFPPRWGRRKRGP